MRRQQQAFTLTELIIAIAIAAVVLMLAVPSFLDYMRVQRLKSINAQLVTDLMLARSEAVTRGTISRVNFGQNTDLTCYTLYVNRVGASSGVRCDCTLGAGAACGSSSSELRTVQVLRSTGVAVQVPSGDTALGFSHVTGALVGIPTDQGVIAVDSFVVETSLDSTRLLRDTLGKTGRVTVCGVGRNLGAETCP
ncbi:MAG: GspH/FimT family pseudopilin [Rubrivivax sp.]